MWLVFALAVASLLTTLHVVAMALASIAVGARPARVQIFLGPSFVLRRADPEIRVGAIPLAGYLMHPPATDGTGGEGPYRVPAERAPDTSEEPAPTTFARLSAGRKTVVLLGGSTVLLALALALTGVDALGAAARLPAQLAWLGVDHGRAVEALRGFAHRELSPAWVGTLAAKLAAANLLPLPGTNGGQLVALALPERVRRRGVPLAAISSLAMLVLAVALVVALARV